MQIRVQEHDASGISVIICCYNSAGRLPQTLAHLAAQVIPDNFFWEILLINNASTDNTVALTNEIWEARKPVNATCRIIDELTPGQMYARKTGVREAKYEYLVFCDDDNLLDKNYVFKSWQVMTQHPNTGIAGGQIAPISDIDVYPDWFEEYKANYAIGIPAEISGDITERGYVVGAGMVTKRSLFLEALDDRYPSLLNGRDGEKLSTGDDFEYCKRLLLWDYRLYYDQDLKMQHFIPKERLTAAYRDRLLEGIVDAQKILLEYHRAHYLLQKNKGKNKWRLLLMAPLRICFASLGLSRRSVINERMVFFYMAPFPVKSNPVRTTIKNFIHRA